MYGCGIRSSPWLPIFLHAPRAQKTEPNFLLDDSAFVSANHTSIGDDLELLPRTRMSFAKNTLPKSGATNQAENVLQDGYGFSSSSPCLLDDRVSTLARFDDDSLKHFEKNFLPSN